MNLFLNRTQIGEVLKTSPNIAVSLLSDRGIRPVDLGRGRGRGLRWYAPAVQQAAKEMHEEAQPQKKEKVKKTRLPVGAVSGRSPSDLYNELTGGEPVQ